MKRRQALSKREIAILAWSSRAAHQYNHAEALIGLLTSVRDRFFRPSPGSFGTMQEWREDMLSTILIAGFWLGAIAYLPALWVAVTVGVGSVWAADTLALTWIGLIAFRPTLPYRFRALSLLGIVYSLGLWFLFKIGPVTQIYILSVPIMTGVLLGFRPALVALACTSATVLGVGLIHPGDVLLHQLGSRPVAEWTVIALNFAFIDTLLTLATAGLLHRLEAALNDQRAARASLEANHRRLVDVNEALTQEILQRTRAEEEMERLVRAVEQAREVIIISDLSGRIDYSNRAFEVVTGRSRDTVIGSRIQDFVTVRTDDRILPEPEKTWSWNGTICLPSNSGGKRQMESFVSSITAADGEITNFVAVLRDVTNERLLASRLKQSEKLEAVGTLAAGIAHDFNNIIGSILAVAESAQQPGGETVEESMQTISVACSRAQNIVRQMLALSRTTEKERAPIELRDVIEETLPLLRAAFPKIEIRPSLHDVGPVSADASEIQQIVMNLASNAVHAMNATARPVLSISLERFAATAEAAASLPSLIGDTAYSLLAISDNGSGIPATYRDRIFDPFFTTKGTEGTGLGLASVHGLVSSLGGAIIAESEPGMGTTFRIYLPEMGPPRPQTPVLVPAKISHVGQGKVLLVDDETVLLNLTGRFLRNTGYTVTTAKNGEDASVLFCDNPAEFDLVITDLTMHGISGLDLIGIIRTLRSDLPVIMTTGFGDLASRDELQLLGNTYFLQKPYSQKLLAETAKHALATAEENAKAKPR